jgi:hypothetical protein
MSYTETLSPAEPLRPQFFVTRQNGTMIPLIAADELPSTVSIRGVPRLLSPHDISGMTSIGTFNSRHRQYVVEDMNTARGFQPHRGMPDKSLYSFGFAPPGRRVDQGLFHSNQDSLVPTPPRAFGIEEQPPSSAKPISIPTAAPVEAGSTASLPPFHHNVPDLPIHHSTGVKEYCSYWLRHGECDYAQQGCLYKHEMPLDRTALERLGYRDIPRWYREKHGLGSYLAGANLNSSPPVKTSLMEKSWRRHPVEVLLEATQKEPQKAKTVPSTTSNRSNSNDARTILTGSLSFRPKSKATVVPRLSKEDVSPTNPHAKLENPQAQPPAFQTIAQRQINQTIQQLDDLERAERERINGRYRVLSAQSPPGISIPANTPRSSTNGESRPELVFATPGMVIQSARVQPANVKPVANHTAKAAKALPPPPVNPFSRVAVPPGVGKKKARTKRDRRWEEGGNGRASGKSGGVKEKVKVERLVDDE